MFKTTEPISAMQVIYSCYGIELTMVLYTYNNYMMCCHINYYPVRAVYTCSGGSYPPLAF